VTLSALLPFLVLIVAFYFLILRPSRARQSAQAAVASRLAPGVEAMTTSGLFGTVTAVEGDRVELEIADGVRVRFMAAAIASVVEQPTNEGTTGGTQASITEGDTPTG
jgi:preprotein translocase subunit YajC